MPKLNKKHLLILPLLLLLGAVALWAFRYGLADIGLYQLRYQMDDWSKNRRPPSAGELDEAMALVDRAIALSPSNAEYLDMKAYLYWQRIVQAKTPAERAQISQWAAAAAELHRQALGYRPRWPYSWSGLALMKAYQGQADQEFERALANAVQYGPWEPAVHIQVALAGQLAWPQLSDGAREQVLGNLQRGARRDAEHLRDNLEALGPQREICAALASRAEAHKKLCAATK